MDFHFTEEQLAVAEAAQGVVDGQSTVERVIAVEETEDRVDRELWAALAAADLLGLAVPESEGGGGMGLTEACLLLEAQARRVAPVPLWSTLVLGTLPLARFGSPEQRKALLPGVASGETFLSAALTEAAISLAGLPAVTATPSASGWTLRGSSMAVPQAHLAERILVPARTASDEVVVALVDPQAEGVRLERAVTTNREVHPHLHLEDAPVSEGDLLAGPADGEAALSWMLQAAWTGLCALQLGVTESALQQTAEYLNQREQFGRPLSTFQGTLLRAADAAIDVETIRVTLWQAAWRIDTGREAAGAVGAAKWQASERGQRVVHATQHLHGGIGADVTYPIHRYFLWGKQIELMLGGPGVHLAHLGQMIAARGAARAAGEGREGNAD
jgi:3-oxocholest-4-en-26-oyl-CoA dehydrogenase beta subunit